jgi:hypothetical protein
MAVSEIVSNGVVTCHAHQTNRLRVEQDGAPGAGDLAASIGSSNAPAEG